MAPPGKSGRSDDNRPSTPARYKPKSPSKSTSNSRTTSPRQHTSKPTSSSAHAAAVPTMHHESSSEAEGFFARLPGRFVSYAGFRAIAENTDKAGEWVDWLRDLHGTPSEIKDLSAKASTARDTITQIQETLAARPDLLEGESGGKLKEQIYETIASTDSTLVEMTRMLAELSASTDVKDEGAMWKGLEEYWHSWRYKNEFQEKVQESDAKLQGDLQQLSMLMVNVYS